MCKKMRDWILEANNHTAYLSLRVFFRQTASINYLLRLPQDINVTEQWISDSTAILPHANTHFSNNS